MAQLVKHPTPGLSVGLDLGVMGSSPMLGSTLGTEPTLKKESISWRTWVAQSVECLTLDSGSGHDPTVRGFKPHTGHCSDSRACLGFSLAPSLSAPPLLVYALSLSLSLKINK